MSPPPSILEALWSWPTPPAVIEPDFTAAEAVTDARRIRHGIGICSSINFTAMNERFKLLLKRLVFRGHLDDSVRAMVVHNSSWTAWLSIIHTWTKRFCFPEGHYGTLSTDVQVVAKIGVVVDFVLSNVPDDYDMRNYNRSWKYQFGGMSGFNASAHKTCICVLLQIPSGIVDWKELTDLRYSREVQEPSTALEHLIYFMVLRCDAQKCAYGIISDGTTSALARFKMNTFDGLTTRVTSFVEVFPSTTYSLAYCVASIISNISESLDDTQYLLLGAMNHPSADVDVEGTPTCFGDFDAYRLGRDSKYYDAFLRWKKQASIAAFSNRPTPGAFLTVTRTFIIPNLLAPWHFELPTWYHGPDLPQKVTQMLSRYVRRPGDSRARELLAIDRHDNIEFEITEIKQQGKGKWSQVYFGRLSKQRCSVSSTMCLKLFDERLFPVPLPTLFELESEDAANHILNELHDADSLLKREEAAYHRLSQYQGQLIPHFYGCHQFLLPDGQKVFGILMEYVKGIPLSDVLPYVAACWAYEEQVKLSQDVRNAVTVLNSSFISQGDWHTNQILCVPRPGFSDKPAEMNGADAFDLVLIDFAFTRQPIGHENLLPTMTDVEQLPTVLGLSEDLKRDSGWEE